MDETGWVEIEEKGPVFVVDQLIEGGVLVLGRNLLGFGSRSRCVSRPSPVFVVAFWFGGDRSRRTSSSSSRHSAATILL